MRQVNVVAKEVVELRRKSLEYQEQLGELCLIITHMQSYKEGWQFDWQKAQLDIANSYLWERAKAMLVKLEPKDDIHLVRLLRRLLAYTISDVHRTENRDQLGDGQGLRMRSRKAHYLLSGNTKKMVTDQGGVKTIFDLLADPRAGHVQPMEVQEEIDRLLFLAETQVGTSVKNRGIFGRIVRECFFNGSTFKEFGAKHRLSESRVSQLCTYFMPGLAAVLKRRYEQFEHLSVEEITKRLQVSLMVNKNLPKRLTDPP